MIRQRREVMATAVAAEVQKSGIGIVGDMAAWGTHFCLFYETKEDLLSTLDWKAMSAASGLLPIP